MKVYIFGPIQVNGLAFLPVYKNVSGLCKKYFDDVLCTYPDFWETNETPEQFYNRTEKSIIDADLFITEVTSPSTGVGMELQMGRANKIPCIALCKKDVQPSKMVLGFPNLLQVIYYNNAEDLAGQLEKTLDAWIKKL